MMRHPSDRYIRFLVVEQATRNQADINRILSSHGLLPLLEREQRDYVQQLREELQPPPDFAPANPLHRPTIRWLRSTGIHELFYPKDSVEEAQATLLDPPRRDFVEQYLFARLNRRPAQARAELTAVNKKTSWGLTLAGVEAYKRLYWDVDLLSYDDWVAFLSNRTNRANRDLLLLEGGGERLALQRLRLLDGIKSRDVLEEAMSMNHRLLLELDLDPSSAIKKAGPFAHLVTCASTIHNALAKVDEGIGKTLEKFEKFHMETTSKRAPSFKDIAPAGNITGSGVRLLEHLDPDATEH
jgi:hypothetical protein